MWRRLDDIVNAVLLSGIVVLLTAQVVSRYVLNHSLGWTAEAAGILFGWFLFLSAPAMLRRQTHMNIKVVDLSELHQRYLRVVVEILCGIFYVAMFVGSIQFIEMGAMSETPALEINRSYIFVVTGIASALLIIRTASNLFQLARGTAPYWLVHGHVPEGVE